MYESIPNFPRVRDLRFEDLTLLHQVFQTYPPQISEYTFTNLYVWQTTHPVQISQLHSSLLILRFNSALNHMICLPPIGNAPFQTIITSLQEYRKNSSPVTLYGLSFDQANVFKQNGIEIAELRDNWDYLYTVSDLIICLGKNTTLNGRISITV